MMQEAVGAAMRAVQPIQAQMSEMCASMEQTLAEHQRQLQEVEGGRLGPLMFADTRTFLHVALHGHFQNGFSIPRHVSLSIQSKPRMTAAAICSYTVPLLTLSCFHHVV